MYHLFDRKNQLFLMRQVSPQSSEIHYPKVPYRGGFCNRPLSHLQHSRVFLIYVDLPSQNAMLPYIAIGSTAPKYICLRYSWFIPLTELASIQRASVTLEAFEAAILTWSWNLR